MSELCVTPGKFKPEREELVHLATDILARGLSAERTLEALRRRISGVADDHLLMALLTALGELTGYIAELETANDNLERDIDRLETKLNH